MREERRKKGLHYFSEDETQLYLLEGDYVEYYARDIHQVLIFKIIGANHDIKEPNKVKYTGVLVSGQHFEPIWHFRGLACNTRKLDAKMVKTLYE